MSLSSFASSLLSAFSIRAPNSFSLCHASMISRSSFEVEDISRGYKPRFASRGVARWGNAVFIRIYEVVLGWEW